MMRIYQTAILSLLVLTALDARSESLASWNDSASKTAIVNFIEKVTTPGTPDFIPVAERIAVFDNDGTLWSESPVYFQAFFILDRVRQLAPHHPDWETKEPFASVLRGDLKTAFAGGERAVLELVMATHAGMTTEEFDSTVTDWIATARHPESGRLFTDMVYQPMLELLAYLRQHEFKTYIVSGGGVEFMRPWMERVYGIPPEQVIGSSIKTAYEIRDGKPVINRLPEISFVDDKEGKPVGIHRHIGRRPVMAFGNSDGDYQMLDWTTSGEGSRLAAVIHHDDADREQAYDRDSHVGRLAKGLDDAPEKGWIIVSMKDDWQMIYPEKN